MSARSTLAVAAAVAASAATPATADAGTYSVAACGGQPNNSWTVMSADAGMSTYPDPPFCSESGLVARNVNQAAGATIPNGSAARWRFDAPAGTAIVGATMNAGFQVNGQRWQAVLSNGSQVLFGCPAGRSCSVGTGTDVIPVPGSPTIYTEAFCATGPCDADGLRAQVFMRSVQVILRDDAAPTVANPRGAAVDQPWIGGTVSAAFVSTDSSGVAETSALLDGRDAGVFSRPCDVSAKRCPDFDGSVDVSTKGLADGRHKLLLRAVDRAGNVGALAREVDVDNTPPTAPEGLARTAGEWTSTQTAALRWTNPVQEYAPIAGAEVEICPAASSVGCTRQSIGNPAEAQVRLPAPGLFDVRLWLRDAAGNAERQNAAEPVRMGWDADAPTSASFAAVDGADPSLIRVDGADQTSGVASGTIEYRRRGAKAWRGIRTSLDGSSIVGRMPDGRLRDGRYELRASVRDAAGNARSTRKRADGRAAVVRLPLRVKAKLSVGHRARGGRLQTRPRVRAGNGIRLAGRLVTPGGNPIRGATVTVSSRVDIAGSALRPTGQVRTDSRGRFRFRVGRGPSRIVRFAYAGAPLIRPQLRVVRVRVPAVSSISGDRRRVVNGDAVTFTGRVRTGPIPDVGKLVELQFFSRGSWRTFKTTRTDKQGRWRHEYRFTGTVGRQTYRLRARIPRENGYQYATGSSRALRVTVQGL